MIAIFKREFKNFFQNVMGWVFIAAMVFIAALYFDAYNIGAGRCDIINVLISLVMIFAFAIPVLTMRILSEERKNKTDQLVLTAPVKVGSIVFGKFLAVMSVMLITTLAIGGFLLLIAKYAEIEWCVNFVAMFGFFLYGCACIALCMFVSAFTESQVIAAILGIVAMFFVYIAEGIEQLLIGRGNKLLEVIAKGINVFDYSERFDVFLSGILDVKAVLYFISMIVVFLFLTTSVISRRRYTYSLKNIGFVIFRVAVPVVVIAIAVAANILVLKVPSQYTEMDVTKNKLYSLSDETKQFLDGFDENVKIYVYASENSKDEAIDRILSNYVNYCDNILVEYKDPNVSPKFYTNFTDETPTYNSVFMESSDNKKFIDYNDMFVQDYGYDEYGNMSQSVSLDVEGKITSGLNYLENGVSAKIYVLNGHNEAPLEEGYFNVLNKNNIQVDDISLITEDIPEDCELLLINGPTDDLSKADADKIIEFLKQGGNVIITLGLVDDVDTTMPNFSRVLKYFELSVDNGLIVDDKMCFQTPYYIVADVLNNVITQDVYDQKYVLMPYAKGITYNESSENVFVTTFLTSSGYSYEKLNLNDINDYMYSEGDPEGPFNMGLVAKCGDNEGTAYVFATSLIFSDVTDEITSNSSVTIFMNVVGESIDTDSAGMVVVPVRKISTQPFMITEQIGITIFMILWIVVPAALLVIGFIIWFRRRRK